MLLLVCPHRPHKLSNLFTHHSRYHSELLQTAPVEIRSAVLADGDYAGALVHILNSEGKLSATTLEHPVQADSSLPKVTASEVALALPLGISGTPHERSALGFDISGNTRIIEHGIVQPRETDHMGSLAIDWLMGRIAAASNKLLTSLGFTPEFVRNEKISRMGAETKVTYFALIPVGTRLRSIASIVSTGRKNMTLHHQLFGDDGGPLAEVDQTLVTVDMTTRRATELPDFLRMFPGND